MSDQPTEMPTDEALIRAVGNGDASALESLFDRYAGTLLALARRILANHHDAEDVVSQVFWEIWHKSERYDASRSSPRTYLFLVTRSRALDLVRQGKTVQVDWQNELLGKLESTLGGSSEQDPANQVSLEEERQQVRGALTTLSQAEEEALRLAFFQGLTHREIAEQLHLPLGTVKGRIRGGMKKMLRSLSRAAEPT